MQGSKKVWRTRLRASRVRMLCVQMLRLTRYMPMPWTRIALHAARASQSSPMPKMITSGAALPLDLSRQDTLFRFLSLATHKFMHAWCPKQRLISARAMEAATCNV